MQLSLPDIPVPLAAPPGTPEAAVRAGAEGAVRGELSGEREAAALRRGDSWWGEGGRSPRDAQGEELLGGAAGSLQASPSSAALGREPPAKGWRRRLATDGSSRLPAPGAARIGQRRGPGGGRAGCSGGSAAGVQRPHPSSLASREGADTTSAPERRPSLTAPVTCKCPPGGAASSAASARSRPDRKSVV